VGEASRKAAAARVDRGLPRIHTVVFAAEQRDEIACACPELLDVCDAHGEFRILFADTLDQAVVSLAADSASRWQAVLVPDDVLRYQGVVGLDRLREQAAQFVDRPETGVGPAESPYFLVVGEEASGKSAVAADLVLSRPGQVAYHFIERGAGDHDDPELILDSLAEQLRRIFALPRGDAGRGSARERLDDVLTRVERSLGPGQKAVLVIDGLDRAFGTGARFHRASALADFLPKRVPSGVRIVLTSRPGDHLDGIAALLSCQVIDLDAGFGRHEHEGQEEAFGRRTMKEDANASRQWDLKAAADFRSIATSLLHTWSQRRAPELDTEERLLGSVDQMYRHLVRAEAWDILAGDHELIRVAYVAKYNRGRYTQCDDVCQRMLDVARVLNRGDLEVAWLHEQAVLHHTLGRLEKSEQACLRGLLGVQGTGQEIEAHLLCRLGMVKRDQGWFSHAIDRFEQSARLKQALLAEAGDVMFTLGLQAEVLMELGDFEKSRRILEPSHQSVLEEAKTEKGLEHRVCALSLLLVRTLRKQGDYEKATRIALDAKGRAESINHALHLGQMLRECALCAQATDNWPGAADFFMEIDRAQACTRDAKSLPISETILTDVARGYLEHTRGNLAQARAFYEDAIRPDIKPANYQGEVLLALVSVQEALSGHDWATAATGVAVVQVNEPAALASAIGPLPWARRDVLKQALIVAAPVLHGVLGNRGAENVTSAPSRLRAEKVEEARRHLDRATELCRRLINRTSALFDVQYWFARARLVAGRLNELEGDLKECEKQYESAFLSYRLGTRFLARHLPGALIEGAKGVVDEEIRFHDLVRRVPPSSAKLAAALKSIEDLLIGGA
jgi:tetratricopeptide (TPR) repeat protein